MDLVVRGLGREEKPVRLRPLVRPPGAGGHLLLFAPEVFLLPLFSGVPNPMGRLGESGGAMSWLTAYVFTGYKPLPVGTAA